MKTLFIQILLSLATLAQAPFEQVGEISSIITISGRTVTWVAADKFDSAKGYDQTKYHCILQVDHADWNIASFESGASLTLQVAPGDHASPITVTILTFERHARTRP